jgi:hypothetical protein
MAENYAKPKFHQILNFMIGYFQTLAQSKQMANIGSICSPRFSDSSDIVATNL